MREQPSHPSMKKLARVIPLSPNHYFHHHKVINGGRGGGEEGNNSMAMNVDMAYQLMEVLCIGGLVWSGLYYFLDSS